MTAPEGTYRDLKARWKALNAHRADVRLTKIASGASGPDLLRVELGESTQSVIALAAGVHGDEPAGPWALLELVETGALDRRFGYRIWPCLNPTGLDARTRENVQGVDVNRTFGDGGSVEAHTVLAADRGQTYVLSLDLHEDCDASGFYCYEYGGAAIGRRVISALGAAGFTIDPLAGTFDLAGPLDDAHCLREHGRIVADPSHEAAILGGLSYSLAIARRAARFALTFETPSRLALDARVAMHRAAVTTAVAVLLEESASIPFK